MNNVFVILPTLNPNEKIMSSFIDDLMKEFKNIVVVNDGSNEKYDKYFELLKKKNIIVLKHYINLGKGRGLKTAINYILNNYDKCDVIVTADSDGQHSVKDIKKCAKESLINPKKYILGCRDFDKSNVPFKSKFGNKITRNIFKLFIGLNISDTQTGLRAMSRWLAPKFLETKGERYEYETNTLIECKTKDISIKEVPIDTIYIDNNSESHFNPVKDSIIIYKLFIKYIFASLSSTLVDLVLFAFLLGIFNKTTFSYSIILSTIIARIISCLYNFKINEKLVFKKVNKTSIIKYFVLVFVQMFVSGIAVNYLCINLFNTNPVWIKLVVDLVIFIVNFFIQREYVFNSQ